MIRLLLGNDQSATLNEYGVWNSDNPILTSMLNSGFNPELYPPTPAEPIQNLPQARAAAKVLNGKLRLSKEPADEPEEGRVY